MPLPPLSQSGLPPAGPISHRVNRIKHYIRLMAIVALIPMAGLRAESPSLRFEFTQPQMGVPFRIILYAPDEAKAREAATAAFARISDLNRILSNYETDSELSQLGYRSGTTAWFDTSEDLFRILSRAQRLAQATDGAFDITVGPVAASWRNARRTLTYPHTDQLKRFMGRIGWQQLKLDYSRRKVSLRLTGMRLDPGGIAKGDALDQALHTLCQQGIESALVAGAGDIAVSSPPPEKSAWRIQLSDFSRQSDQLPAFVDLKHQAIATSGDLFQYVEIEGTRYSHIVNPKTGIGLTQRRLVSVIAPRGSTADSLATACAVIDVADIDTLLRMYPNASARTVSIVDGDQQVHFHGVFEQLVVR